MDLGDRVKIKIPGSTVPEIATITKDESGVWPTSSSLGIEVHVTFEKDRETVGYAVLVPQWFGIDEVFPL